jgi:AcrR family transcriptional regulator
MARGMAPPSEMHDDPHRTDRHGPAAIAMLDAAERLFAEHAIGTVSLRQIVIAAGQGNLSAAHYHFGSREGLIRAVLERRMRTIDVIRHRRLDALEGAGRSMQVPAIVGAAVETLAEVVADTPWGADYVRVLAQALFDPRMRLLDTLDPTLTTSIDRTRAMARAVLPDIPAARFDARVHIAHHEAAYTIARWIQEHGPVQASNRRRYRAMVRGLVEFLSGGVAAPVSARVVRPSGR